MNFCNFIQQRLRADDFQMPPHRQAVTVMRYFSKPLNDRSLKKIILIMTLSISGIISFGQSQLEMNQEAFVAYQKADSQMTIVYKKVLFRRQSPE